MNALPLIHRELLVGSRKRSTYWLRLALAGAALLLGALLLFSLNQGRFILGAAGPSPGMATFYVFVWVSLASTGLFGVFFAADAISFERREGTLGLLFLTRLRARDVVLGKLAVTTLRAGYTLLAALPVLALPLLMGGVTFKAYGLVALVLANTLFLSVAAGLAVSSFTRQPTNGVLGTLFLVLAVALLPLWVDALIADWGKNPFVAWASHLSPGFAAYTAVFRNGLGIGTCLGLQHGMAWFFLALAVWGTARLTEKVRQRPRKKLGKWLLGTADTAAQRRLRDRAPVQWLTARRSRAPTVLALLVLILVGLALGYSAMRGEFPEWRFAIIGSVSMINGLFFFALSIWMAAVAARRTGDSRREGALELLLATPLTVREIVTGHWRGLCRVFGPAVLVVVVLEVTSDLVSLSFAYESARQQPANVGWNPWDYFWHQAIRNIVGPLETLLFSAATLWMGLWLGLRLERPAAATALTWFLVFLCPGFAQFVAQVSGSVIGALSSVQALWLSAVLQGVIGLVVYAVLIVGARRSLLGRFHAAATGTLGMWRPPFRSKRQSKPPPLPAAG